MLADEDVTVVEKELGGGWKTGNLLYIHEWCAYDEYVGAEDEDAVPLDFFSMMEHQLEETPAEDSPYWELMDYFRMVKRPTVSLSFKKIEKILGEPLDWEAYRYEAFWYDDSTNRDSPLWKGGGFPFDVFAPTTSSYSIPDCWLSQGYKIKTLHIEEELVVFRRYVHSKFGLHIPRKLLTQRLPDKAVYRLEKAFAEVIDEFGL